MRSKSIWFFMIALPVVTATGFGIFKYLNKIENSGLVKWSPEVAKKDSKSHDSNLHGSPDRNGHFAKDATRETAAEGHAAEDGASESDETPKIVKYEEKIEREGRMIAGKLTSDQEASCTPVEFAGRGPSSAGVTPKEWSKVMSLFHATKRQYVKWLLERKEKFSDEQFSFLKGTVESLRLSRPGSAVEPDVSWRGLLVRTADHHGKPLVTVGDGFVSLVQTDPVRAQFELSRVVAQGWAPCQFAEVKMNSPWKDLAKCMDLGSEETECNGKAAIISDQGWAIATAVASQVAPPQCKIPAFESASVKSCMDQTLAATVVSESEQAPVPASVRAPASVPSENHDKKDGHGAHEKPEGALK